MKDDIFKDVREEWGDYLKTNKKINKGNFDTEGYDFGDLFECYKVWRGEEGNKGILKSYQIAVKLLKEHKIPFLSEDYINEFAEDINSDRCYYKGLFFSAMINELYKDEEIHLYFNNYNYLGGYNKDKKIVIEGDCSRGTGLGMKGGEIIVKGDCEYEIGSSMRDGNIKICGDNFNPRGKISCFAQKGEIYHKDKLVWKDGRFVGEDI